MPTPRVLILRAPGTNCDVETAYAFERAGGAPTTLHINRVLESSRLLDEYQILCIPGGFSYGDDVAAGRIFGNQMRQHLDGALAQFHAQGKLLLGICNGFQVLLRSGLLFAGLGTADNPPATLDWNNSGKFEDRWVRLLVPRTDCVVFRGIEQMYLPIAHAEGRFVVRDARLLAELESRGQIVLRYAGADGSPTEQYPENPNGSTAGIAGIADSTGRICGFMPHPERHIDRTQHPRWTRGEGSPEGDGLRLFRNAVEYFG